MRYFPTCPGGSKGSRGHHQRVGWSRQSSCRDTGHVISTLRYLYISRKWSVPLLYAQIVLLGLTFELQADYTVWAALSHGCYRNSHHNALERTGGTQECTESVLTFLGFRSDDSMVTPGINSQKGLWPWTIITLLTSVPYPHPHPFPQRS